jgi:hypothetical protein
MDTPLNSGKRFIFDGSAVAFAGHIRRPDDCLIPAIASSCLPVTGGLAEASSGPQNYKGIISFDSASTRAHGDYADTKRAADFTHGNHDDNELAANTFVESTLKGLTIQMPLDPVGGAAPVVRTFAAETVHVRLETLADRRNAVSFRMLETTFDGVTVDGNRLRVTTASHMFGEHDTFAKLSQAYTEDGKFRKQFGSLFYPTGHEKTGLGGLLSKHQIPHINGTCIGTIVQKLEWEDKPATDVEIVDNQLHILGIGSLFFGEIVLQENFRRITALRFHLDSTSGADASACEVQASGREWPPAPAN